MFVIDDGVRERHEEFCGPRAQNFPKPICLMSFRAESRNPVAQFKGTFTGCLDFARHDNFFVRALARHNILWPGQSKALQIVCFSLVTLKRLLY
jgi:hypothetical protein